MTKLVNPAAHARIRLQIDAHATWLKCYKELMSPLTHMASIYEDQLSTRTRNSKGGAAKTPEFDTGSLEYAL